MTRIIAGQARGRRLQVPPSGTRPTSDRAREGLFNSLATMIELSGACVLDLYAGSAAVGLEALSRGASTAVLVESDRQVQDVIGRNVEALGLTGATVFRGTVESYLSTATAGGFDFVFADPPYQLPEPEVQNMLALLTAGHWLRDDGVVVVERSARGPAPVWPDPLELIKQKRYGEGMLWYGRRR